jgi:hypothetical protein
MRKRTGHTVGGVSRILVVLSTGSGCEGLSIVATGTRQRITGVRHVPTSALPSDCRGVRVAGLASLGRRDMPARQGLGRNTLERLRNTSHIVVACTAASRSITVGGMHRRGKDRVGKRIRVVTGRTLRGRKHGYVWRRGSLGDGRNSGREGLSCVARSAGGEGGQRSVATCSRTHVPTYALPGECQIAEIGPMTRVAIRRGADVTGGLGLPAICSVVAIQANGLIGSAMHMVGCATESRKRLVAAIAIS